MRRNADRQALVEEAALLKVLSDPTRLRLAVLLSLNGETCVCTLAEGLAEPEYKISRHLAVMRSAGLVAARREGTWMHYRLREPRGRLETCLRGCFRDYLTDDASVAATLRRVKAMSCEERKR
jgi:ArsR family transcriptional regulator